MKGIPLTVGALMTPRVVSVGLDATLIQVNELMQQHGFRHIPVVDDGVLMGIVSDLDVARQISPKLGTLAERTEDRESLNLLVHRFMTRHPLTVTPEAPVREAAALLLSKKVGALPVVGPGDKLVGIVTVADFLRLLIRKDVAVIETAGDADGGRPANQKK